MTQGSRLFVVSLLLGFSWGLLQTSQALAGEPGAKGIAAKDAEGRGDEEQASEELGSPEACWIGAVAGSSLKGLGPWKGLRLPEAPEGVPVDLKQMIRGATALEDGDYEVAITAFEAGLETARSPYHHSMRVALPELYLQVGRARDAVRATRDLLARFPTYPWRANLLANLAAAYGAQGKLSKALATLHRLRRHDPDARELTLLLACAPPGTALPARVDEPVTIEAARAAFVVGRWAEALDRYKVLLGRNLNKALRREVLSAMGRSAFRMGDLTRSHGLYKRLWEKEQDRSGLFWALKTAFMSGQDTVGLHLIDVALESSWRKGATRSRLVEYLQRYGHYQRALELYTEHLAAKAPLATKRVSSKKSKYPGRSREDLWRLAWLLWRTGEIERSLVAFEAADRLTRRALERQRTRYWTARAYEALGDKSRATARYNEVIEMPGGRGYYRLLASSRLKNMAYARALPLGGSQPLDHVFERARLVSEGVDAARIRAVPRWRDLVASVAPSNEDDRALLDRIPAVRAARFLLRQGQPALARDYLRILSETLALISRRGVGLWSLIGHPVLPRKDWRGWTTGHWGETLRATYTKGKAPKAWRKDRAYLRDVAKVSRSLPTALVPLFAAVGDEALLRKNLRAYGDVMRARCEPEPGADLPAAACASGWRDGILPEPEPSLQAQGALALSPEAGEANDEDPNLPLAYRDEVLEAATRQSVDPFLVWAVMYNESRFDERVVSAAGAMGLMQIMPETGERLHAMLRGEVSDHHCDALALDAVRLYDPATNIRYGVAYLRALLDRFRGQEALAIAAYNAGPIYLKAWVERKHEVGLDIFVEEIPFDENREYVRRVMSTWLDYRSRYGFGGDDFLSNRVDGVVEEGVTF